LYKYQKKKNLQESNLKMQNCWLTRKCFFFFFFFNERTNKQTRESVYTICVYPSQFFLSSSLSSSLCSFDWNFLMVGVKMFNKKREKVCLRHQHPPRDLTSFGLLMYLPLLIFPIDLLLFLTLSLLLILSDRY